MVNGKLKGAEGKKHPSLDAPRGLKRLGCVDVEKSAKAFDRDFRHRLSVPGNQMTRADIAVERHQFVEETARPQHGIATLAIAHGDRDQMTAIRRERIDQMIDQASGDHRHVAEADDRAVGAFRDG